TAPRRDALPISTIAGVLVLPPPAVASTTPWPSALRTNVSTAAWWGFASMARCCGAAARRARGWGRGPDGPGLAATYGSRRLVGGGLGVRGAGREAGGARRAGRASALLAGATLPARGCGGRGSACGAAGSGR